MNQHLDRINGLAPFLQTPALTLIELCQQKLGRTLLVVSGWRSVQEQALRYQQGRSRNHETGEWEITDPAHVVTRAKPGTTAHTVITRTGERASLAMDVIPLHRDGTADWTVDKDFWDALYELAWKCGLDPLGDPSGAFLAWDRGHFEEPCWKLKLDGLGLMQPVATFTTSV